MTTYNKTQLNPDAAFERHVYHRDQFAHYLRWSHVLKRARIGMRILDFGCGSANLFEVLYRNRYKPQRYLGLDIRKQVIKKNQEAWGSHHAEFEVADLCGPQAVAKLGKDWDLVCSFEVAEHVGKTNVPEFLDNLKQLFNEKTVGLISTPCYDPKVGAADNHIIDGQVGELTYEEFKALLSKRFNLVNHWGTFCSVKDYKPLLTGELKAIYDRLHEYYDSNVLSVVMAPLFPTRSRNVLWEIKL